MTIRICFSTFFSVRVKKFFKKPSILNMDLFYVDILFSMIRITKRYLNIDVLFNIIRFLEQSITYN